MDCPVCKNAMITVELADVEIDNCTACGGVWLDSGELELLLGDRKKAHLLISSFTVDEHGSEQPRRCPICDKKMEKVLVGKTEPPLRIDRCSRKDGLWLDNRELQDVIREAQLDEESKTRKLLLDIFGQGQQGGRNESQ